MNKRKIQAVINRLNDEAKQLKSDSKVFRNQGMIPNADFAKGTAYGLEEAISKLEILSKEMGEK
tara:strand:+ start:490 stop:681 length:192 start_codon:yes stop_codon:yes gene_type:complete